MEIWFNYETGEIKCVGRGMARKMLGPDFERVDLDPDDFHDCSSLESKIDYIKCKLAVQYPPYAASLGY